MVCSGNHYTTKTIDCKMCKCVLDNGNDVCIAYEVNAFGGQNVELNITGKDGQNLDTIPGTRCNATVNVIYLKDEDEIFDDHVQKKIDSKHRSFPPQPELSTDQTTQGQTNTHTTSGKARLITHENDLRAEKMIIPNVLDCGNNVNHYKAAFIASIAILFLICVALVIYFTRKKLRDKTSSSGDNYVTQLEANTQNENRYSAMRGTDVQNVTVDETSHAYQVLAYHRYDEIDDIGHEYLELISQRRETTDPVLDVDQVLPGTERFCANAYAESLNA